MIKITTLHLKQTCTCVFTFSWLSDNPSDQTFNSVIKTCEVHSGLSGLTLFNVAIGDNQRMSLSLKALKTYNEVAEDKLDDEGNIFRRFNTKINWFYTGSDDTRVLNIDLTNTIFSDQKKSQIQNIANSTFGVGKVLII